jgi:DNA invertase Pin-like site-specific DNA recombinase
MQETPLSRTPLASVMGISLSLLFVCNNLSANQVCIKSACRKYMHSQKGTPMAQIGYARISTGDQTLDLQREALREAGCLDIYEEQASGARVARPVLSAALRACRESDMLVVWKLDRLGRNTTHLIEIVEALMQRGIGLKTLTGDAIDTSTPHGTLALHMFAALAEYERALMQERVMAGIAAARGRKGGRRPKLSPEQQPLAVERAQGRIPVAKIARTLGCSRHTVYKALGQTGVGVG